MHFTNVASVSIYFGFLRDGITVSCRIFIHALWYISIFTLTSLKRKKTLRKEKSDNLLFMQWDNMSLMQQIAAIKLKHLEN